MQEIIKADQQVFAKDSPLSLAKEVQGLRAVFDEVSTLRGFVHIRTAQRGRVCNQGCLL